MLEKRIPVSGEAVPVIGLGTWRAFDVGASASGREPLRRVLAEFVRLGGRLVDTSPMYGSAEAVVGDLAADLGLRKRLFVATKVWTTGRGAGLRQIEQSLARLRGDPIDLLQVHNLVDVDVQLATLRALKREGRVRHIGITHYQASGHAAVRRLIDRQALDFVQINYSVGEREAEHAVLPAARDRGVAVIANRPFASGDLVRRLAGEPIPSWGADIGCTSWPQLLLKFVVSHPAVTCAIPATADVVHLAENVRAGHAPMPDDAMRQRIAEAAADASK